MYADIVSPLSDINQRDENQDAFGHFATDYGSLFILADGMGGANGGLFAAQHAVARFPEWLARGFERGLTPRAALELATSEINHHLFELATSGDAAYSGMGTTLAVGLETDQGFLVGHIGDSRVYLQTEPSLVPLTQDHGPVADMVANGDLTWEESLEHPQRGFLSRAMGTIERISLEMVAQPVALQPGQGMLFCTDGLCGFVQDNAIEACLRATADPREVAPRLVALAKRHGSDDNITVLYVFRPPPPPRASRGATRQGAFSDDGNAATPKGQSGKLLALLVFFGLMATAFHFSKIFRLAPSPGQQAALAADGEEDPAAAYSWSLQPCPMGVAERAKSLLGGIGSELRAAGGLSLAEEIAFGEELAGVAADHFQGKLDTDPGWSAYLNRLGESLLNELDRPGMPYRFYFVADETTSAVAMPGGHIYVFEGLLDRVIENEAQLAFVLQHEIAHVDRGHCATLAGWIQRLPGGLARATGEVMRTMLDHTFNMTFEEEADRLAAVRVAAAGYSPFQAVAFLEAMTRGGHLSAPRAQSSAILSELEDLLNTHPNPARRMCALKNQILGLVATYDDPVFFLGRENYRERVPMGRRE